MESPERYRPAEIEEGTMSKVDDDISWHDTLELKLRKLQGEGFQGFFASLMEARHGDDYSRSGSGGRLGDKGCDGYLQSDRTVFACYGARNGESGSIRRLTNKMEEDFAKARELLNLPMENWCFTHNLIDGLPVDALEKLNELAAANPSVNVSHWGFPKIKEVASELPAGVRQRLIGPIAQNDDYLGLQAEEVKGAIDAIMSAIESTPMPSESTSPVAENKLEFNNLSGAYQRMVKSGRMNSPVVESYLLERPDPNDGDKIAKAFREKYDELKAQDISSNLIFHELYVFASGPGTTTVARQVAVGSILSYLFDRCDIFDNPNKKEAEK